MRESSGRRNERVPDQAAVRRVHRADATREQRREAHSYPERTALCNRNDRHDGKRRLHEARRKRRDEGQYNVAPPGQHRHEHQIDAEKIVVCARNVGEIQCRIAGNAGDHDRRRAEPPGKVRAAEDRRKSGNLERGQLRGKAPERSHQRCRKGDRSLQRRHHGAGRSACARHPGADRRP